MTKKKDSAEKAIRDIRRATRRRYSAEEKIRIVLVCTVSDRPPTHKRQLVSQPTLLHGVDKDVVE